MPRFAGQTAFITGASSGIGAEVALQLAREGAKVAIIARREDRLEEIRKRIKEQGGDALALRCDVTDRAQIDAAVAKTVEKFGGIDLCLANAGFGITGSFAKLATEDYRRQFDTNFFGAIDTAYAVLPHLIEKKGRLGIVASVSGRLAAPGTSAYNASKFALVGLAETIYHELRKKGVSVTLINPGLIDSEIRLKDNDESLRPDRKDPVPGWLVMPAEKAARQILSALYKRKPEVVITFHGKILNGLARHFPRTTRLILGRLAR